MRQRNRFIRSFCLEAVHKDLQWRLKNLWPLEAHSIPNLHCLPVHVHDPFGRPILVLRMNPIAEDVLSKKQSIFVYAFEKLRLHLKRQYDVSPDDNPTLQYVVLLDLNELSLQSIVSAPSTDRYGPVLYKVTLGPGLVHMDSEGDDSPFSWDDRGRQVVQHHISLQSTT